ncbi:MAG: ATP-binding cassette domain-containing protein [Capnocytophaga granulosa]
MLDKLDVTIENGDRLVVAGHNGAGKSTLLRIIAGEDTSFSGEPITVSAPPILAAITATLP